MFHASSGLRQGDPISPFLFTILTKHLSLSFKERMDSGKLQTYKLGGSGTNVKSNFADDVAIFARANESSMRAVKDSLQDLLKYTGLQIVFDI